MQRSVESYLPDDNECVIHAHLVFSCSGKELTSAPIGILVCRKARESVFSTRFRLARNLDWASGDSVLLNRLQLADLHYLKVGLNSPQVGSPSMQCLVYLVKFPCRSQYFHPQIRFPAVIFAFVTAHYRRKETVFYLLTLLYWSSIREACSNLLRVYWSPFLTFLNGAVFRSSCDSQVFLRLDVRLTRYKAVKYLRPTN